MESILVAIISGGVTLIGTVASVLLSASKQRSHIETKIAVIDDRINRLTESVDKHNGFAQKIPAIETRLDMIEKRLDKIEGR